MLPPRAPLAAARDRKGDRTRERLFQAALAEFRDTGFDAASVGAIAQRAGTSRASFYFYYPSKEAVLLDLQWRVEMAVVDQTRDRAGLAAFLDALIDGICTADTELAPGGLLRVMLAVYIRQPAGLDLSEQPFPLVMEVARRFIEARDVELRPGLDPAQATELFLAGLFGLLAGTAGPVATRRDALRTLTTLFLADESHVER